MDVIRIITESHTSDPEETESTVQKRTVDEAIISGVKNLNQTEITWKEFSDGLK